MKALLPVLLKWENLTEDQKNQCRFLHLQKAIIKNAECYRADALAAALARAPQKAIKMSAKHQG